MTWIDAAALLLVTAQGLLVVVGLIFLLSGLDDLFIDLTYWLRAAYRRVFVDPRRSALTEQQLLSKPEQWIAIMIPAWDESAVIRRMLENTLRSLNYQNYRVFVGTYPNDVATQQEVEKVREQFDRVQRITTPHDGPSNKADCLNWVFQGIRLYEKQHGMRFEIVSMQDCEDIVHPLTLKLLNCLMPLNDMVQLPVLSLPRKWHEFTGAHYIDEFAQLHYKDMVVREVVSRSIPASGVGCAFSRRALETVATQNYNQIFNIDSLTEDYDLGLRLKRHGMKQTFAKVFLTRVTTRPGLFGGKPRRVTTAELICIREYFPASFKASVKQKSRWVVGIALQGWASLGWHGDLATKYMLFRDRKALVTNLANLFGYLIVPIVVAFWLVNWLDPDSYHFPPILERGSWLWDLLIVNFGLLLLRILQRGYCVWRFYSAKEALLSFPRMVWGNFINFFATARAIKLYLTYLRTGKLIAWDKTSHMFPSEAELMAYRRKLGDLLLEQRLLTVDQLADALVHQRRKRGRLGEILIEMGLVDESGVQRALQMQGCGG